MAYLFPTSYRCPGFVSDNDGRDIGNQAELQWYLGKPFPGNPCNYCTILEN